MKPIAVFYHCVLNVSGRDVSPIITEQMRQFRASGLLQAASHIVYGINAGEESRAKAKVVLPEKGIKVMHGEQCKTEIRTMMEIAKWVDQCKQGWNILYFHTKGAKYHPNESMHGHTAHWRRCMGKHLVRDWARCVKDLDAGRESVGCHWHKFLDNKIWYWAGNFWWATSDYLMSLPRIEKTGTCVKHGPDSHKSRYEAEVWIGRRVPLPTHVDYHPNWKFRCPPS